MEHVGVGTSTHGPKSINIQAYNHTHIKDLKTTHVKMKRSMFTLSLSTMFSHSSSTLKLYLPTTMFINFRQPRCPCERLVTEHGMLMPWKGYE